MNRTTSRLLGLLVVSMTILAIAWRAATHESEASVSAPDSDARTVAAGAPLQLSSPEPAREPLATAQELDERVVRDSGEATLIVHLRGNGRPVWPAILRIDSETRDVEAETGQALFGEVTSGRRWICLVSLPAGWLAPRTGEFRDCEGILALPVEIHPGANTCDIDLEGSVRVFGRVVGPDGESLAGARVSFVAFDSSGTRIREAPVQFRVDASRYEGELHAGIWLGQLIVRAEDATNGRSRLGLDVPLPSPQARRLHAGVPLEIDFVCERLPGRIEGRVVDELARPVGGLHLAADSVGKMIEPESASTIDFRQPAMFTVSAENGTFSFRDLSCGSYTIRGDSQFRAVASPGLNQVGRPVEPKQVELGTGNLAKVELAVLRSRPIHVRGTIETNLGSSSLGTPSVNLTVQPSRSGGITSYTIDGAGWRFDFYVEAATADPVLEITFAGRKSTYPLTLSSDSEPPPLVLRFPN